jgi:hypothetical protein
MLFLLVIVSKRHDLRIHLSLSYLWHAKKEEDPWLFCTWRLMLTAILSLSLSLARAILTLR